MTQNENLKSVSVLVPSKFNRKARERLMDVFDAVLIDRPDPSLVPPEKREAIRGMAAWLDPDYIGLIDALPNLEIAANFGVGYDPKSSTHAIEKGVVVTHTPTVLNEEVADIALALLLNTARQLFQAEKYLREGRWAKEGNFPLTPLTLRERTVGIYGLGRIGKAVAHRVEAFGLPIHYHNRSRVEDVVYPWHRSLESLAEAVDTLICVVPGTAGTRHTVTEDVLRALGPNGILINIGRGNVIDEKVLIEALRAGTIAAAGLDVFEDEPRVPDELIAMENVSLLPHVASASIHTRGLMGGLVADNLISWFASGKPVTPVPEAARLLSGETR